MAFEDATHRPHAIHTGQTPHNIVTNGPYGLKVTLDTWGPVDKLFTTMYDALVSNWGEEPERSSMQECQCEENPAHRNKEHDPYYCSDCATGWCKLTPSQRAYVESCFAGKTLQQVLETITFTFTVDGCARAFTHEFVRARIGSGFMQHGGRDNDWRHRLWTMPETIRRMVKAWIQNRNTGPDEEGRKHCVVNWTPMEDYLNRYEYADPQRAILDTLTRVKALYAALVDSGIPWQDARRVLPIGTQTYIHGVFNYVALKGVLAHRLEHIMDWEINCVAQLMLREITMKCPPLLSKYLGSHSDLAKQARFDGLESWPPDGKWPSHKVRCKLCKHSGGNHHVISSAVRNHLLPDEMQCEVCSRDGNGDVSPLHRFEPEDILPRMHRREQMPFFVLHPDSMQGGPIKWLWTNGQYNDIQPQLESKEADLGNSQAGAF